MSGRIKYQASKSTSNKRPERRRDILSGLPHSEFLGIASTFSGLVLSLLFGITIYNNTSASSINITIPSGSTVLNTLNDGTFSESTVNASALVWTDNYTGYNLTITSESLDGALMGAKGGTIPSIQEEVNREKFASDATLMNKWGFKPSKLYKAGTTIDNSNYIKSPTSDESVIIDNTKTANDENHKNTYTLALAAKVDNTTPLDSYSQTFTLAATGNATEYHIAYVDANNNMPGITYGESDSGMAPISGTVPHKDGYIFGGWCTVSVVVGENCVSKGGQVKQANDSLQLDASSANNKNLYAIWQPATFETAFAAVGKSKVGALYKMQDMNANICSAVTTPTGSATAIDLTGAHVGDTSYVQRTTLYDERDGNTYLVSKLADGHCWMSQNLALWLTAGENVTAYNFSTGQTFNYSPANTTQTTTGTVWEQNASDGAQSYSGDKNKYIGGTDIAVTGTVSNTGEPYEKIEILYNWAAATAQTGTQAVAAGASGEQAIPTSICPKGWRLPANSGDYSFSALMGSYGLPTTNQNQGYSKQLQNPLNFNRPGHYSCLSGDIFGRAFFGYFWSAASFAPKFSHSLTFDSTRFNPQSESNKGDGFPVRCVAV